MNTRACILLLALAVLGTASTYGRLGETPARIAARYGPPVKVENGRCSRDFKCVYEHGGFTIAVQFLDDRSECERYSKDSAPISEDEIQKLLEVNRQGSKWSHLDKSSSVRVWRSDSGGTATFGADERHAEFEIVTRWWREYVAVRPKEAASGAVEGLKDF